MDGPKKVSNTLFKTNSDGVGNQGVSDVERVEVGNREKIGKI
jgi:hypothetical protein